MLLTGPPGCGKATLLQACVATLPVRCICLQARDKLLQLPPAQGTCLLTMSCSAMTDSGQLLAALQQACGPPVTTAAGKAMRPEV